MKSDLSKYQRQIQLKTFGLDKQIKLSKSQVLIVGIGGLGIPVAQYLNAMGIGTLGLLDNDTIELHNLHRQVLYSEEDLGKAKVEVATEKLRKQNSNTAIHAIHSYLSKENALEIIRHYDVVVDATDNFATRYLINDACIILDKPFVYGALHDFEGQVSVFNYQSGPTYRCLFPSMPGPDEIPNCDENGVLGILPGIIGSLQALEVIKILTGLGEVLSGKLLLFDGLTQKNQMVQFKADPKNKEVKELAESYSVSACASEFILSADAFLELKDPKQIIDVRSQQEFQVDHLQGANNIPLPELEDSLHAISTEENVYFICQSGQRSEAAVQKFKELCPDTAAYSIEGGMNQISALCH